MKHPLIDRCRQLFNTTLLSTASLAIAALASAQQAQPPQRAQQAQQGGGNQTWADQQRSQAFATQKLAQSPRRNQWVEVPAGGRTLKGWVVYPDRKGKAPVVLVLHEVFGLTDSTRNTADQIAALGYIAITPDMVSGLAPGGGDISAFPASRIASSLMTAMNDVLVNARLDAWADYGTHLPEANGQFAIVGLSWGGGAAFRYVTTAARSDLKAVCVFYDVGPPAVIQGPSRDKGLKDFPVGKIRVPVYGFYPDKDTRVMASLEATKAAMASAHNRYEPVIYQNAEHAYMRIGENPADGNPANAAAVKASLARLEKIFKAAFR